MFRLGAARRRGHWSRRRKTRLAAGAEARDGALQAAVRKVESHHDVGSGGGQLVPRKPRWAGDRLSAARRALCWPL